MQDLSYQGQVCLIKLLTKRHFTSLIKSRGDASQTNMSWFSLAVFLLIVYVAVSYIWKTCPVFVYYVKYYFMLTFITFVSGVALIFSLRKPTDPGNIKYVKACAEYFKVTEILGIKTEVYGDEYLKQQKKPYVLAINHQATLDGLLLLKVCPDRISLLVKWSLQFVPIFGFSAWLSGVTFLKRGNTAAAIKSVKDAGKRMHDIQTPVFICPEGTRIQCDSIKEFKKGAFHLAVDAQVPIMPVIFSNYRNILDRKNKRFGCGTVRIHCLPEISTEGLTKDDVTALTEKCHQKMLEAFKADMENHTDEYKDLLPLKTILVSKDK